MKLIKLLVGSVERLVIAAIILLVAGTWVVHKGISMIRSVNTASFTTKTVTLSLSGAGNETYTALNMSGMQPGANLYVGLTVTNGGSSDFAYNMVTTPSGDGSLTNDLSVGVVSLTGPSCSSSAYSSGVKVYPDQRGLAGAAVTGRPLSGNSSDYLCLHLQLPWAVPKSVTGSSAAATLDFTAQQP